MRVIRKFPIISGKIVRHAGWTPLRVGLMRGALCVWAEVDLRETTMITTEVQVVRDEVDIQFMYTSPDYWYDYLGSCNMTDEVVVHVYEKV